MKIQLLLFFKQSSADSYDRVSMLQHLSYHNHLSLVFLSALQYSGLLLLNRIFITAQGHNKSLLMKLFCFVWEQPYCFWKKVELCRSYFWLELVPGQRYPELQSFSQGQITLITISFYDQVQDIFNMTYVLTFLEKGGGGGFCKM